MPQPPKFDILVYQDDGHNIEFHGHASCSLNPTDPTSLFIEAANTVSPAFALYTGRWFMWAVGHSAPAFLDVYLRTIFLAFRSKRQNETS